MTEEQLREGLLPLLAKIQFFLRPHEKRYLTPINHIGYIKRKLKDLNKDRKDKGLAPLRLEDLKEEINIWHFFALELIEMLTQEEGKCRRPELRKLFLWKFRCPEGHFNETVMERLEVVGLIEKYPDEDRRATVVRFTKSGKELQESLKAERRAELATIIKEAAKVAAIEQEDYESLVTKFQDLADSVWKIVRANATKATSHSDKK